MVTDQHRHRKSWPVPPEQLQGGRAVHDTSENVFDTGYLQKIVFSMPIQDTDVKLISDTDTRY